MTTAAVLLMACALAANDAPEPVTVSAEVMSPSIVGWEIAVRADGSLRGRVTDGEKVTPFSARSVAEAELGKIRTLARCVISQPKAELGRCPESDSLNWPPGVTLRVRVGTTVRESSGCVEYLTTAIGSSGQPTLELLLVVQGLLPASRAYDVKPRVLPILNRLTRPGACKALNGQR